MDPDSEFECALCKKAFPQAEASAGQKSHCTGCRRAVEIPTPTRTTGPLGSATLDSESAPLDSAASPATKECPFCAEPIDTRAGKCLYCGESCDQGPPEESRGKQERNQPVPALLRVWGSMHVVIFGFGTVGSFWITFPLLLSWIAFEERNFHSEAGLLALQGVCLTLHMLVSLRVGQGLRRGERAAVLGLCVLGCVALLVSFLLLTSDPGILAHLAGTPRFLSPSPRAGIIALGTSIVLYSVPIGVGLSNRQRLT